ncbi:MAG TPA: class II D-tagatose-bisphosphate aldolase, non-catalytic subunit [Anaerolineae bacterium]|nr:class II D-tagatose-bisphosphate aldolase, non-catalytic subunit [Anaerolineae bacterium]
MNHTEYWRCSYEKNQQHHFLDRVIEKQNRGEIAGVTSICSANSEVLKAALIHAQKIKGVALIESTCNQVNQYGGYTGMTPLQFVKYLRAMSERIGLSYGKLLIGGDHLGPNVWKKEPTVTAMGKSRILVRDYIRAGYQKIHIDSSMRCADDPQHAPLAPKEIAERTADLAAVS